MLIHDRRMMARTAGATVRPARESTRLAFAAFLLICIVAGVAYLIFG